MKPNLVDRDIYKLKVEQSNYSNYRQSEQTKEELTIECQVLKQKMSEKLKFVLSDKDKFDPFEDKKNNMKSK